MTRRLLLLSLGMVGAGCENKPATLNMENTIQPILTRLAERACNYELGTDGRSEL